VIEKRSDAPAPLPRTEAATPRVSGPWVFALAAFLGQSCGQDQAPFVAVPDASTAPGRADVLRDGRIVLEGCPAGDRIDTNQSYDIATPEGSCEARSTCDVHTVQWCPGGGRGPAIDWACDCVDGAWNCAVARRNSEYCLPLPNAPPPGDSRLCVYDPGAGQAIACDVGSPLCSITTVQPCPAAAQSRKRIWSCTCETHAALPPGLPIWTCQKQLDDDPQCAVNTCPIISASTVSPARAAIGQRIELRAAARDAEGDDVTFHWTTTLGRLVNPGTGNTSFVCPSAGWGTLTVTASDGICDTSFSVDIECLP
jgi:hypothetical protein